MSSRIHVIGGTLAGLAVAARLARAGHQVSLDPAGPLGGHGAPRPLDPAHPEVLVDDLEPVLTLPAAWRDLLKKSGRAFGPELTRRHLDLVAAPPAVHRFADGTELVLPDDRAGHLRAMRPLIGEAAAQRWTSLLDRLDRVWQALRQTGLERPFPAGGPDPTRAQHLWAGRTLGHLARELDEPRLGALLLSAGFRAGASDPERAPAWLATRWTIPRTFGRWHLISSADIAPGAAPMGALVEVLTDRLIERGVELEASDSLATTTIDARVPLPPHQGRTWWSRLRGQTPPGAVRPPAISHDLHPGGVPESLGLTPEEPGITAETVFHTDAGPVVAWVRHTPAGVLVTSHDHTHLGEPTPSRGWDLSSWRSWVERPGLEPGTPGQPWRVSAASHAGNEPWAEALSAALVTYLVHEQLTGEDIRPTNAAARR